MWREFDRNNMDDVRLLENLCRDSGSPSVAREAAYIRKAIWLTKDKPQNLWCEIYDDIGFYLCTRCKSHVRGILTVVHKDYHGHGIGKIINDRRLLRMKYCGIQTFKFRTNINERAINFWQRQGARIVGLKGDDYEMELTIKQE